MPHCQVMDLKSLHDRVLELSDEELAEVVHRAAVEQARRAIDAGDPEALLEDAFEKGFSQSGAPYDPVSVSGIVACMGVRNGSQNSHKCSFVVVDSEYWSWEHPDLIISDLRYAGGDKSKLRAVSLLPAIEGRTFTVVQAKRTGSSHGCKMQKATSFAFENGRMREKDNVAVGSIRSHSNW